MTLSCEDRLSSSPEHAKLRRSWKSSEVVRKGFSDSLQRRMLFRLLPMVSSSLNEKKNAL